MKEKIDKYSFRIFWSEEDNEYVGECLEFPGLSWLAPTQEEALSGIKKLIAECVEDMLANEEKVPEPLSSRKFSGRFTVRISPELHRKLTIEAKETGISLNKLAMLKLAS